ncbi:hypothetical protein HDU97_003985 [Phlyctochytrium planicorne]|nr:hypothetical protein HDU97_003985 [Phlyctochytrium planicorne]
MSELDDDMMMGFGEGDDAANNKRKRITQACDSCNKKKIKCDGLKPTCTNCSKSNNQCSYSRGAKKRGPRAGYIESLENRLKEMEALLQPLQPEVVVADMVRQNMEVWPMMDKNAPDGTTRPLPMDKDGGGPSSIGGRSPSNLSHNDSSGSVDAEIIGSQGFSHRQSTMKFGSRLVGSGSTSLSSSSTAHIPPEAIRELLDLYFTYIHPTMPLVHMNSFMSNFANESPLLLNSMYALAARYSNHPTIRSTPDMLYNNGDIFYNKARELVDHYMDVPNTSTVTALLCLATYAAGSGRGSAAWMYSGMAIRMAQELKLNIEPEFDESSSVGTKMSWLERERRRRIWWTCFVLDRYAGAAADRSMIINEKDCKVYLPSAESLWKSVSNNNEEPVESIPSNGAFQISVLTSTSAFTPGVPFQNPFGYFVLLTKVFGKIIEYTNMHKNSGKNGNATNFVNGPLGGPAKLTQGQDPEFQLSILDASLKNWFTNIPDWMKNLGGDFTDDLASENPPSYGVAYLHIFYHTCMILLYRPKMMTILRDNPKNVQRSPAFSVCHSSASEVTSVIRKVQNVNPDLYFMTAFVAFCIFQSGLIHVMAAQVSSDAQVVENSKRNADLHVSALAGVAKYWFMAGRLHSVLKNLIESAGLMKEAGFLTMSSAAESDRIDMRSAVGSGNGMPSAGAQPILSQMRASPPVLVQQAGIRDGSPNNGIPISVSQGPLAGMPLGPGGPGMIPVQSPPHRINVGGPSPMMETNPGRPMPTNAGGAGGYPSQQASSMQMPMAMDLNIPMTMGMNMPMVTQPMYPHNQQGGMPQSMPRNHAMQDAPLGHGQYSQAMQNPYDPRMASDARSGMQMGGPSGPNANMARNFGMNPSQATTEELLNSYNFLSANPFNTAPPAQGNGMMPGPGNQNARQPMMGMQGGMPGQQIHPGQGYTGYGAPGQHPMDSFQMGGALPSDPELERVLGGSINNSFFKGMP